MSTRMERQQQSINELPEFVAMSYAEMLAEDAIQLDGEFSIPELKAIIAAMESVA